jgi:hypothetical protein
VEATRDAHPLTEATSVRSERFCLAGLDEGRSTALIQLDDEVTGTAVAAGEEVSIEAQAREAHHGRARDTGVLK